MASNSRASIVIDVKNSMSAKLHNDAPLSATSCIFRVPELLRKHNPDAYQPHIVSIGPLHLGTQQLQPIQDLKQWYLQNLLSNMKINSLDTLIEEILIVEERAREFYEESLDSLSKNDFVEMLILDGCFLIQLFRKFHYNRHTPNNPVFNMDYMIEYLYHDLLLLENQLPWFVLDRLYTLTLDFYPSDYLSLRILILTVLSSEPSLKYSCKSYLEYVGDKREDENEKVVHILDLIRTSFVFPLKDVTPPATGKISSLWKYKKPREKYAWKIPPATKLAKSGVEFKRGPVDSKSILNIKFKKGVFTIPQLLVTEMTEPLLRNLIAFEQCYRGRSYEITSYAVLLGRLIGSSSDMELLCEDKIIDNWLSADDGSKQVFNKLYNDTWLRGFLYHGLCAEVNTYYEVKWNHWEAKLKRDYCANPWMILSLIAAGLLLCLTAVQTVYTLLQYY
ncbi:UPF0481 protein At3g47200-like [Argentina anserina]|uniref:UPF0481 protein At3g47200-like n=1 Tax=Argentina anserina TaxID=57926 RepID=UPI0021767DBA|nr:UPF0481 protein At3g47200-like [Potentilla anserina]